MEKLIKLIYHYHSGFSVQAGGTLLVFDYWEGEDRRLAGVGRITPQFLRAFERIFVFISHAHPDHLDPIVYTWENEGLPITYIVSSDAPVGTRGKRMTPGQEKILCPDVKVKAFPSTDLGVSFLVELYGIRIFHAGDLNLWHWRQESSLREIEAAETAFQEALEPIRQEKIDVAMFPVDPRQGMMYDAGANQFILNLKPRVFIPMHWQERPEVAIDFARRSRTPQTEVLSLTKPGVVANLSFTEEILDIHIIEPPKDFDELPLTPNRRPDGVEEGEDPFADSDLPVDIL